ncbi:MAG TPA: response regulator [Bryobacteraceae bacterium]|jgi:two-component system, cell cycle sensor histidine kinase and response regulator CckA|nr:response regulator [Bryobacteraceae bacterium]
MQAVGEHRATILVVDDDPAVLVLIQAILVAADYRVWPAVERADAVRMARQKHIHIDLVLMDVRLPGVIGTELADEILSIRPDVRVLWMSGFVDAEVVRVKLVDEYAGFLPKPLHRDGLLSAVEQAIQAVPQYQDEKPLTAGAAGICS